MFPYCLLIQNHTVVSPSYAASESNFSYQRRAADDQFKGLGGTPRYSSMGAPDRSSLFLAPNSNLDTCSLRLRLVIIFDEAHGLPDLLVDFVVLVFVFFVAA